jgi:hypothetical protein
MSNTPNDDIEFEVRFGNIKYDKNLDGTNGQALFDKVYRTKVNFTNSELANWGTDDSYVYTKIAEKLGFSIIETTLMDVPFNI